MRKSLRALTLPSFLLGASFLAAPALAQQATSICVQSVPPGNCFPVSTSNPLPVTGGGGGVSSNITQWGSATLGAATAVGTATGGLVPTVNAYLLSGGAITWPGSAGVTSYGGTPSGTVPAVNAYVTNATTTTVSPFAPNSNFASLSVGAASSNVALPAGGGTSILVANTGQYTAFVNLGTSNAVTAAATNTPIAGGATTCFSIGSNTYLAGIETAGTTTLSITGGSGNCAGYQGSNATITVNAPPNDVLAGPQNITGAATLPVNSQGSGAVGILVTGTFTGAAWTIQGSVDCTTYATIPFWDNTNSGTIYTAQPSATTGGTYKTSAAGYRCIRINVSALSTGTLVATLNSSAGSIDPPISAFGTNTNITGVAGTATAFDPCTWKTKTNLAISSNATALTQIIAASGSTKIYVCSLSLVAAGATAYNLNTGTSSNCGSNTAALLGSTTAANGLSFAANGGITLGNGGATILVTPSSSEICTLQSNAVYVSGSMTYVQQ